MLKFSLTFVMSLAVIASGAAAACAQSLTYATSDPEIEMWFYPTSSANGLGSVRDRGSSFATYSFTNEVGEVEFYGGSGLDSSRRGSVLIAVDTSATIPRLAPECYRIDALKVNVTLIGSIGTILYDNTPDDMLELTTAGGDDPGHPLEMWGVGFDGDYSTFGFAGETSPEYFNEGDRRWPIVAGSFSGPYQVYGIDGEGRDVENAVFGGYSATAVGNVTEQFTPSPFAIGRVYDEVGQELAPGTALGSATQLQFEFNLADAGVVSYVQQSLAAGHLGMFLSSLHEPLGHTGTVAYPDYYLDNVPGGPNPNGAGPAIELAVTILPGSPAGDYDGNGGVDGGDLLAWQRTVGQAAMPPGSGADGDASGWIDAGDLATWGAAFSTPSAFGAAAVPEPAAASLAVLALAAASLRGRDLRNRPSPTCGGRR
jgi:hypothetical protein